MPALGLATLAAMLSASLGAAGLAALWLRAGGRARPAPGAGTAPDNPCIFLFRGAELADATPPAAALLAPGAEGGADDWPALRAALSARFPRLPETPDELVPGTPLDLPAADPADAARLRLSRRGDDVRVTLHDPAASSADRHLARQMQAELELLRAAHASAPSPCWQSDACGRVLWANAAYLRLAEGRAGGDGRRLPTLFDPFDPATTLQRRLRRALPDGKSGNRWFEIRSAALGNGWINYASDITAEVNSEIAQRNFVQTLTKIFAQLSTGLAIFDRGQRLVLFNPALIDLTGLPADLLSARPGLASFFDLLRDKRVMPEPKDYRSWREQLGDLLEAASDRGYSETWSLPSGLTYRVTGRPHPDGAVAFLIEDISSEVSLTRRFRSELEQGQAVLDALDEALAVFSPTGVLTFCNAAYRRLWNTDPDAGLDETSIADSLLLWRTSCQPSPLWEEVREAVGAFGARRPLDGELARHGGARLRLRCVPLAGGATLIAFAGPPPGAPASGAAAPETPTRVPARA